MKLTIPPFSFIFGGNEGKDCLARLHGSGAVPAPPPPHTDFPDTGSGMLGGGL